MIKLQGIFCIYFQCIIIVETRKISRKASYKIVPLPVKLHPSRVFSQYRSITKNDANRKKVRKMHKCDEKGEKNQEEMEVLSFRNDCVPCRKHKPTQSPKLHRLKKLYETNEMKYNHGPCVEKYETKPDRMDVVRGCTIKPKKLPRIPKLNDCNACAKYKPTSAPKLVRPKQMYDPYRQERSDHCQVDDICETGPPRMDAVLGWTVKQKSLPKFPTSDCTLCRKEKPLTAPKLVRPHKLYDVEKIKYDHKVIQKPNAEVTCVSRMDDVVGFQIKQKKLLDMSKINDCVPCQKYRPKYSPKLRPLKKRYDQSKMKYSHLECAAEEPHCPSVRMDSKVGLKITRKVLPKIEFNDCTICQTDKPCSAPPLRRLKKLYDLSEQKYKHPVYPEVADIPKTRRMDEIAGFDIKPKKLPPIPTSSYCKPCLNHIATEFPKLGRIKKLFDDSKMVYRHQETIMESNLKPPDRMDDIVGYKPEKKQLCKLLTINECVPCQKSRPKNAPKLVKPEKLYNDMEMQYPHKCSIEVNHGCPERMDDVMGFKIKAKNLPKLVDDNSCKLCQKYRPSEAPTLTRPTQLYDPTSLDRKDEEKEECIHDIKCPPRMDDVVGCTAEKKSLPILKIDDCKPCQKSFPINAPKLVRLKRKYDPSKMLHYCKKLVEDECELDPPRMDDVLCWKPKKKKLPSIFQKCGYCTLASRYKVGKEAPIYNTYAKVQYTKRILQNVQFQSKRYYPRKKPSCGPNKGRKSKKHCPKFKMGNCPEKPNLNELPQCKKIEPPYESYNENFKGFHERDISECSPYHLEILQPKYIKSSLPFIIKPPPPKFAHIDPDKERRCLEDQACADEKEKVKNEPYEEPKPNFKNPCGKACKLKGCKPRVRSHCGEATYPKCEKIEAPYESFSDHCPQFPPVEFTECGIADSVDLSRYLHMNEVVRKRIEDRTCQNKTFDYEKPDSECDYRSGGPKKVSKKGSTKKGSKCDSKTASKKKSTKDSSHKMSTKSGKTSKASKKKSDKGSHCKPSKTGSKTGNTAKNKKAKWDLLKTKNKPSESSSRKASNAAIKTSKQKIVTRSKSTDKCRQTKHSNEFCCNINNENPGRCCIPNNELMDICKKRHPQTMWEKICAYFRARPNCPHPDDWKKKQLLEKAEAAAKAAGMELCPARKKCSPKKVFYARTVKQTDPCQFPPEKRKRTYCCKKPSRPKNSCTIRKYHSDCRPTSNLTPVTKKIGFLANPLSSKITTNSHINKTYRHFNTYSNILIRTSKFKNIRKQILQKQPIFDTDSKLASYANHKPCKNKLYKCSSLADNYVGKIYKLKLTKIGVRNALITRKATDDAHTFCYICKIVHKDNSIYPKNNANIKNIKIKTNPERRTTF